MRPLALEEEALFEAVRARLTYCDESPPTCRPENMTLPTRHLNVGTTEQPALRITESKDID